jgi:2-phosphosulfolactate phosphatase
VVRALDGVQELAVICAGRENRFSLDDALCAGLILHRLSGDLKRGLIGNDAARVVLDIAEKYSPDEAFLRGTRAGQALEEIGLDADLAFCASLDRHALVPEMKERRIGLIRVA